MHSLSSRSIHLMYLLCTDGLTDLLRDDMILQIALRKESVIKIVYRLKEQVIDRGVIDNTTLILCKVADRP